MMADIPEPSFERISIPAHVEHLTTIDARTQNNKQQNANKKKKKRNPSATIDEQLEQELAVRQTCNDDSHIDYHA